MCECTVKIFGRVEHPREDGRLVGAPFGIYTLESLSEESVRFSGRGLPTFELAHWRVVNHMGMQMKLVSGRWP